ncbi:hypothetical protein AB0E27_24835 [Streptomyces sparsogenes]|uniref:hypothetical protein n=1 Tax=Streptomyces sparsogenes TaxID=67365 RepID=UPI0033E26CF0
MPTLHDTAKRIETGSVILARRIGHALTPEGRPIAAAARLGAVCLITPPLYLALEQSPLLVPIALGIWCRRAWAITQPVPPDPAQMRRRLVEAVLELIGDRPGIHLAELYPGLLASPWGAHLDETRLREQLQQAGLVITRSMRVDGVEGRSGIRRTDAEAALRALSPSPAPNPSPTDGDAGQATPESGGERAGERAETP